MNSINTDLKFTMELGGSLLCFLDLQISLKNNHLSTTVYSKPTDSHLYLHANSCHNLSSINGIPKGVALRLRRICSTDDDYQQKSGEYTSYLVNRGYDQKSVKQSFDKVNQKTRTVARKKVVRDKETRVVFATKFNPRGPNVTNIIKNHLHIIENQPEMVDLFPSDIIIVGNKRESNLKDLLLRSDPYNIKKDLTSNQELGYIKCKKNCDSCNNYVKETTSITSHATGRRFKIRRESTCTSKNVIYVAYCKSCGKQGVGSTVAWKSRLSNYKSHIKNKIPTCRIVRHFIEDYPDDSLCNFGFIIVDVVNNTNDLSKTQIDTILLQKEKFWIGTLLTQHKGLNGKHDWNRSKRTDREKQ